MIMVDEERLGRSEPFGPTDPAGASVQFSPSRADRIGNLQSVKERGLGSQQDSKNRGENAELGKA